MAYNGYRGQCVGRILCFLYRMNPNIGENCYIGENSVSLDPYMNEPLATFTWNNDGDGDVPIMTFTEQYADWKDRYQYAMNEIVRKESLLGRETYSVKAEKEKAEAERKALRSRLYQEITGRECDEWIKK